MKRRCLLQIDVDRPTATGYLDYSGNLDTCIALRTIVLQNNTAYVQAGAGIVYDSDPLAERHETEVKISGLINALRGAR